MCASLVHRRCVHKLTLFPVNILTVNDIMLVWEQYDKDTWGCEWESLKRLGLIKKMEDGSYTCLVGTTAEMEWASNADNLSGAKALCIRYMILANNCTSADRLKKLSYKL